MTPGARLAAVIDLYDLIIETQKPSDQVMQFYFRQRKYIGSKDRRFIADTTYTLLRHFSRLSWWVEKTGMNRNGRSVMLLWLALAEQRDMNDLYDLFDGSGYGPDSLSRFEKNKLENIVKHEFEHADMPENIRFECPDWAYDGLKQQFAGRFTIEMNAVMDEAPLDLRVNTLKSDRATIMKKLRRDDFVVHETPFSPYGLRVQGRPPFSAHPLYQDGQFDVQDEGSQLLSLLCGAKPGEWVTDFCAGAGGKTLALAAQMQNKGRIWACDIEENRLENSRKRLRRAGVHCVELKLLDDEHDDWVKKHKGKSDCVLIDAPCTGVGTWRRNPFSRWQNLGPSLSELLRLQKSILQSASRLTKSGGRLLYATCSLLPQENDAQVAAFLAENPTFQPVPLIELWQQTGVELPQGLDLSGSSLQLSPAQHKTDGFFISAMKRL